jgi:hypothetical protein
MNWSASRTKKIRRRQGTPKMWWIRGRKCLLEPDMKNSSEQSLRGQIEKWLAPSPSIPLHVTRFSRAARNGKRYVCVETSLPAGTRALFFFRHPDGCWCVFPPVAETPRLHFI